MTIRSAGTRTKWGRTLRRLQRRYPEKRLNEFSPEDLKAFLMFEIDGTPRAVAGATILSDRTCLRSFFSWCEYAGLVEHDPSAALLRSVKAKAQPQRQHHWLSTDEISSLFDACNGDSSELRGARDAVVLGLGVFCGLRVHEIAKATWGDVNLRSSQLFVLGKGGKAATLPMPPQLVELLAAWRSEVADGIGRSAGRHDRVLHRMRCLGGAVGGGPRHVQMQWGRPIGTPGILSLVHRRGAEIGVPELAPHDLRRTFAGILEDGGMQLREVSHLLRHSSVATTERYLSSNPGRWKQDVAAAMIGISTRRAG